MNRLGKTLTILAFGLCGSLFSCKKSDSSASGAMFIESCALNCSSNGATGGQISCGVSSIFQNQEVSVLFSKSVRLGSVGNQSFEISELGTGTVPVGLFLIDPLDARRVIFRPDLTFDVNNNPVFGFRPNTSYQVVIAGTSQGDPPPYVESLGGTENRSRLSCTITTDLGISDPVPGPPIATVLVKTAANPNTPANGATGVLLSSTITINFNDLINKGTLALPVPDPLTNPLGIGSSPALTVKLDPDGNISNTSDQVTLQGKYSFTPDLPTSTTKVVFDLPPGVDFPSAGVNPSPRKIILNLGAGIKDLKGNALANPGPVVFVPEAMLFQPVVIPTVGPLQGEKFTNLNNCDQDRSGASWGETSSGKLTPGLGGGSGRLGDLTVATGQVVTLRTGPTFGVGRIKFVPTGPLDGDVVEINGLQFLIVDNNPNPPPPLGSGIIEQEGSFGALTLANLVRELNNSTDPLITPATYALENSDTLRITYDTPGSTGLTFTFDAYRLIGGVPLSLVSISGPVVPGGTAHLLEGVDNESFAAGNLLDNFDFQSMPGVVPNPIAVANGTFEFATLTVENGGTLRFEGPKPARLLVRGRATISGTIDVSGESLPNHQSDSPSGQLGGMGGPNGGAGGAGADRPDNSGTNLLNPPSTEPFRPWDFGIVNPGASFGGFPGTGVGQVGTIAAGPQGIHHPLTFPVDNTTFGQMQTNIACASEQVGAAAGGGAFSLDGGIGVAVAENPQAIQGDSNTPPDTAAGNSTAAGLEDPTGPLRQRKLTPELGYLLGGSGGGGGGSHVAQTMTNGNGSGGDICLDPGALINQYRSHSAGGGGGGGGGIQVQAGRGLVLAGGITAAGGNGGSADVFNLVSSATLASPGGAGSGGAILLQARQLFFSAVPSRMSVAGGAGGTGFPNTLGLFSTAGFGGEGLARVEATTAPLFADVASILDPFDPLDPNALAHSALFLSVGTWVRSRSTPASFQGAQSCWMRPPGSFFALQFQADAVGAPGWDMDLELNLGGPTTVVVPYRSPNGILFGGQTYEQLWGQLLDADLLLGEVGAPLVVRFQGAKLAGAMPDPCHVANSGPTSPISPGSLTPWVRHPEELNHFTGTADMIRFAIIFDASKLDFLKIVGVTNLRINALPN